MAGKANYTNVTVRGTVIKAKSDAIFVKTSDGEDAWFNFSKKSSKITPDAVAAIAIGAELEMGVTLSENVETKKVSRYINEFRPLGEDIAASLSNSGDDAYGGYGAGSEVLQDSGFGSSTGYDMPPMGAMSGMGGAEMSSDELSPEAVAIISELRALRGDVETLRVSIAEVRKNSGAAQVSERELADSAVRQATLLMNTALHNLLDYGKIKDVNGLVAEVTKVVNPAIKDIAKGLYVSMQELPLMFAEGPESSSQGKGGPRGLGR